jgi:hypothetical protein
MVTTGIRRISMPPTAKAELEDFAWRNHKSVSLVIREVLEEYRRNPEAYRALPDMDGALSGRVTAYVPDAPWFAARDMAYTSGRIALSVVIRKGVRAAMERERIPESA